MSAIINIIGIRHVPIIAMPSFTANHFIGNQSQPRVIRGAGMSLMGTYASLQRTYMEVHHARV